MKSILKVLPVFTLPYKQLQKVYSLYFARINTVSRCLSEIEHFTLHCQQFHWTCSARDTNTRNQKILLRNYLSLQRVTTSNTYIPYQNEKSRSSWLLNTKWYWIYLLIMSSVCTSPFWIFNWFLSIGQAVTWISTVHF
jgi:hypothetical protein